MGDKSKKNDDKVFDTYDCVPGRQGWEKFEQDVFGYGSSSNELGDSYADVFRGANTGGPAGPAHAGGPAAVLKSQQLQRKLTKEAFRFLYIHVHEDQQTILFRDYQIIFS